MKFESVPVVDIAPFIHGDAESKRAVAHKLAAACEEIGFFTIVGHGVSEVLIAEARAKALAFFALPAAVNREVARPPTKVSRG